MAAEHRFEEHEQASPAPASAYAPGVAPDVVFAARQDAADPAELQVWVTALEQEIRAYRSLRRRRLFGKLKRWAFLGLLTYWWYRSHPFGSWWMWLIWGGGGEIADAAADARAKLADRLANKPDPRAVNVLARAARFGDGATRTVAERGLQAVLPRMQPRDAVYLADDGWDALVGILADTRTTNADLLVAILKGLEQIGDRRAIPAVQKRLETPMPMRLAFRALARLFPRLRVEEWSISRELRRVQDAARECLPYLQARAEQERMRTTLLRPAAPPADPAAMLLRPAASAADTAPEHLLRPADGA